MGHKTSPLPSLSPGVPESGGAFCLHAHSGITPLRISWTLGQCVDVSSLFPVSLPASFNLLMVRRALEVHMWDSLHCCPQKTLDTLLKNSDRASGPSVHRIDSLLNPNVV